MGNSGSDAALEQPLTRSRLYALAESGRLDRDQIRALTDVCDERAPWRAPTGKSWRRFLGAHLLALSVLLLAAGVTFFLAANWSALSGLTRMALVSVALASSSAIGVRLGLDSLPGRASLALAGLLIGPLLAVYGQTYQTGADAYELFVGWGLLLAPFVFLVRWSGLFVLQVLLLELALALFADQVHGAQVFRAAWVQLTLAGINVGALLVVEVWQGLRRQRAPSRGTRWPQRVFLVGALLLLLPKVIGELADHGVLATLEKIPLEAGALALVLVVVWLRYRTAPKDLFALAAVGLSGVLVLASAVGHGLDAVFRRDEWVVFFTGLFVMAAMGVVGAWVRMHLKSAPTDDENEPDAWDDAPGVDAPEHEREVGKDAVSDLTLGDALELALARGAHIEPDVVREVLSRPPAPPLAVRVLLGLGIWIGAGMVAAILDVVDNLLRAGALRFVLGALFLAGAAFFSRRERWGDVRIHLTILSVVMGEVLLVSTFPHDDELALTSFAAMQLGILVLVSNPLTRFTSTLLAGLSVWLLLNVELELYRGAFFHDDVLFLALVAGVVVVWLGRDRLLASRAASLQAPLGYGLAVSVLGMTILGLIVDRPERGFPVFTSPFLVSCGLFVLCLLTGRHLVRAHQARGGAGGARRVLVMLGLCAGLVAVLASRRPELLAALLLLALGHARRERGLYALGLLLLGGLLVWLYYELGTTLLWKSLHLLVTGGVLLVVRHGVLVAFGDPGAPRREALVEERVGASHARSVAVPGLALVRARRATPLAGRWGTVAVAAAVTLALGVPYALAAHREQIARTGTPVLLELAPADPRSLMQGDYMTLRYAEVQRFRVAEETADGNVVVELDHRGVGRFVRFDDGAALADGQLRLRYRKRRWNVRIGAESFFFEEGQGARYQSARFGELRVSPSGEVVLVGLRDAELHAL